MGESESQRFKKLADALAKWAGPDADRGRYACRVRRKFRLDRPSHGLSRDLLYWSRVGAS
jgi:hypothetical protein